MGRIRLFPLLFQNGCSQSSRFLPQARRIVGSGDENVCSPFIKLSFIKPSSFLLYWRRSDSRRRLLFAAVNHYLAILGQRPKNWKKRNLKADRNPPINTRERYLLTPLNRLWACSCLGLDTNISKNVLNIYPEILSFFPKNPSKNLPKSF